MRIMLMALAFNGALLLAQDSPKKPEQELQIPTVSDALQKAYWREMALYQSVNADLQQAEKTVALDTRILEEQRRKVAAATGALGGACGKDHELDGEQLKKATIACIPKQPRPDPPGPKNDPLQPK